MDLRKSRIVAYVEPRLEEPILVMGLPGVGEVGRVAVEMLLDLARGEHIADLYSPYFPDLVAIDEFGVSHLLKYELYASNQSQPNLIILKGDTYPDPEEIPSYYEVADLILRYAKGLGSKRVVALEGYYKTDGAGDLYVAGSSKELVEDLAKKVNAKAYDGERIIGISALVLGLAKLRGLEALCILGATSEQTRDRGTAVSVLKALEQGLSLKLPS